MRLTLRGFYDDYGQWVDDDGNVTPVQSTTDTTPGWVEDVPVAPAMNGEPTTQQRAGVSAADPSKPGDLSWLTALANAVPKALQLYNAQQIAAVNVKRAQQGLSPLNAGIYGPQVGVGMDPGTQNLVMYGALGIGALLLLTSKKGRK